MSGQIITQFAVREMKIMEDTLKKMGFSFSKKEKSLIVTLKNSRQATIKEEEIICYDYDKKEIDKIKIEYGRNLAISLAERDGLLYEMIETEDEITIYA